MAELSSRYAAALFDLAVESGVADEYLEQAVFLREVLSGVECRGVLAHPRISAAEKQEIFRKSFEGGIHDHLIGFLCLAVAKNRQRFIVPALTVFIDIMDRHLNRTKASVTSAAPLSEEQIAALAEKLAKELGKRVEISLKVDPSVIGGLHIQADGYFIDRTVKKQLSDIKINLKSVQ